MALDPTRLRVIEDQGSKLFNDSVWRATFETRSPIQPNVRGARWNPADVSALYTSIDEATVRAEWAHLLDSQPVRPDATSIVVELEVSIRQVVDLHEPVVLTSLGIDPSNFPGNSWLALDIARDSNLPTGPVGRRFHPACKAVLHPDRTSSPTMKALHAAS